ncbi:MAG TPA: ABC transporter permease [Beutenbergiaceae bacterium]|nr:ABC transporter permease [Beutenbergiaceae bacterium]
MNTPPERPQLRRVSANPARSVWAVLRRELGARLLTSGYVWSTVVFAAMAFLGPLLLPATADDNAAPIAVTGDAAHLAPALEAAGIEPATVSSRAEGEALLREEVVDAVLVADSEGAGWVLLGDTSVPPHLIATVETLASLDALRALALGSGASPSDLHTASASAEVTTEVLNRDGDSKMDVLVALAFGLIIVFVIVLWGATMATDVVQEKATRVVEILVATIRPWQLLAGKVAALTVIGLVQISVVAAAGLAGMYFFAGGVDLTILSAPVAVTGVVSVLIGVPLLAALMAAMAARVEHQEDLGAATQPVYLLVMTPFAAAVYAGLSAPTGMAMRLLSLAPITNIFTMPARVAATPVPAWELSLSFLVGLAALAAVIWLAGRIYSGSILRAGSTVALRDALART